MKRGLILSGALARLVLVLAVHGLAHVVIVGGPSSAGESGPAPILLRHLAHQGDGVTLQTMASQHLILLVPPGLVGPHQDTSREFVSVRPATQAPPRERVQDGTNSARKNDSVWSAWETFTLRSFSSP